MYHGNNKYFLALLLSCLLSLPAQDYDVREKLKAFRTARLDAMRKLGETIQGVHISSNTRVKDFVTENDLIRARFQAMVRGAEEIQRSVHPRGICKVTMIITLDHVIKELKEISRAHPSAQFPAEQFDHIRRYTRKTMFYATGMGCMKAKQKSPESLDDFWSQIDPAGRLMALRSAEIDAYRNMAEMVKGVRISSHTTVRDFVAENDEIRAAFNNFIRGVEFVGAPRYKPEGIVEVTAKIRTDRLARELARICQMNYNGTRWSPQQFYNMDNYTRLSSIQVIGTGVPPHNTTNYSVNSYVPQWANRTIQVIGVGNPPSFFQDAREAQQMTIHAARLDAYHQLTAQIMRLTIRGPVTVRDYLAKDKEMQIKVRQFIESTREIKKKNLPGGRLEIHVEVHLGHMWQIIESSYYSGK